MKIVVLGANGATGRSAVAEALARGHEVVAFVRDPARVTQADPRLTLFEGDALDPAAVAAALEGADAVVSTLGRSTRKGPKRPIFGPAMRNTLSGMAEHGVGRLSVISAQGVGEEPDDGLALPLRLMRKLLGSAIDDMQEMERLVKASDTQWTIMRPGGLTKEPKGEYVVKTGNALRGHGRTRRADLAEALVLAVTKERWPRQAVVVAK
jgi:putative NADH-flavin reductase